MVDHGLSYEYLNHDEYIFVVCQSYQWQIDVGKECLEPFFKAHPNYRLVKPVHQQGPFSIYLVNKDQNHTSDSLLTFWLSL